MICQKKSTSRTELELVNAVMAELEFDRLPPGVRKDLANHASGLRGKRETAHMLDRQFGAKDILDHVLRIPDEIGGFAQFDHILLSRLSRTASIFEPKNYAGRLSRNEHGKWMIWNRNRKFPVPIPNPVAQAKRRRAILEAWLRRNGHDKAFEQVGIFVSIPPTAEIDRKKIGRGEPVYRCDNLYDHWREFGGISPLGRVFSTGVTAPVLIAIAKQLVADYSDPVMDIFDRLGIRPHSQNCDETRNEATDVKPPALPSDQDAGPSAGVSSDIDGVAQRSEPAETEQHGKPRQKPKIAAVESTQALSSVRFPMAGLHSRRTERTRQHRQNCPNCAGVALSGTLVFKLAVLGGRRNPCPRSSVAEFPGRTTQMNMIRTLPRATCPYCDQVLEPWPHNWVIYFCHRCERPLGRFRASTRERVYRIVPLFELARIAATLIAVTGFTLLIIQNGSHHQIIPVIAVPLAIYGATDVADGYLALSSRIEKTWKTIHKGPSAKRRGIAKTIFGGVTCLIALIGFAANSVIG